VEAVGIRRTLLAEPVSSSDTFVVSPLKGLGAYKMRHTQGFGAGLELGPASMPIRIPASCLRKQQVPSRANALAQDDKMNDWLNANR